MSPSPNLNLASSAPLDLFSLMFSSQISHVDPSWLTLLAPGISIRLKKKNSCASVTENIIPFLGHSQGMYVAVKNIILESAYLGSNPNFYTF